MKMPICKSSSIYSVKLPLILYYNYIVHIGFTIIGTFPTHGYIERQPV